MWLRTFNALAWPALPLIPGALVLHTTPLFQGRWCWVRVAVTQAEALLRVTPCFRGADAGGLVGLQPALKREHLCDLQLVVA